MESFITLFEHNDSAIEWPLSYGDSSKGLSLRIPGGKKWLSRWAGLHYPKEALSTSHPDWRIWQAISIFASKPTKESLAELLRTIEAIISGAPNWQKSWFYPWQIDICLTARNAGRPWDEIISCVKAGTIGDEGDWIRWEEQNKKGVDLSQFRLPSGFGISDERLGLIMLESGWAFGAKKDDVLQFAGELSSALDQWPDLRFQKGLVDLCCFALYQFGRSSVATGQTITRFINTCFEHEIAITTPALAAVLFGPFPVNEKFQLLAKAGTCPIRKGWLRDWAERESEADKFLDAIIAKLPLADEWWNVLCAISFLPPLDAMQHIPETFLEQLHLKGESYSKVAANLKLSSLRWEDCESSEVVRKALAFQEDYPNHIWQLFSFIDSKGKRGTHLEAFLVELIKQWSLDLDPELLDRATELLMKLVERRPAISQLPDPAIRPVTNC